MLAARGCTVLNRAFGRYGENVAGLVALRLPRRWLVDDGVVTARRGGLTWKLDLRDNLQWRLFYTGSYEAATIRAALRYLEPGDVVLDVGANIGTFALPIASALESGVVIAVEPAPDAVRTLRWNLECNGLDAKVTVVEDALGREPGTADLRWGDDAQSDTGRRTLHGTGGVVAPVRVITGDALVSSLGRQSVDMLKIDTEGHELDVLAGLRPLFERQAPRVVIIEISDVTLDRAGASTGDVVGFLHDYGFRGWDIRARGLQPLGERRPPQGNAVFLR